MAKSWMKAVCVCRTVELKVRMDPVDGTRRCNCTCCRKRGWWSVAVGLEDVEVVRGEDHVVAGEESPYWHGRTCRGCGVVLFGTVTAPEAGGPRAIVNVRLLEEVDLHGVPVLWLDGLHDTWAPITTLPHFEPEPTRHPVRAPGRHEPG